MKPAETELKDRASQEVEALLRSASGWEPDTPPPDNLAARALARLEEERRPGLPSAAVLFAILTGALAVPSTVALAALCCLSALRGGGSPLPVTPPAPTMARGDGFWLQHPALLRAGSPGKGAEQPRMARSSLSGSVSRVARRSTPGQMSRRLARSVPRARWEVETIEPDLPRVNTPGWIIEPGDEEGTVLLTPGILSVAVQPAEPYAPAPGSSAAPDVEPNEHQTPIEENP